jgi:hypothetical protein
MWSVLAIATLVTWLIAGAAGIYMFGTWLSAGGPGRQRARSGGLPPAVIRTHLGFGALGFVAWASYVVTGWDWLAWTAVVLLMPGIGLGICTVTIWAPYPAPPGPGALGTGEAGRGGAAPVSGMLAGPPEDAIGYRLTDERLARALSSEVLASKLINEALASLPARQAPARKSRRHLAPLIPAGHGIAAVATFVLAVVSAISAR